MHQLREKERAAGDGRPRAKGGSRSDQPEAAASIHPENTQPTLVLFLFLMFMFIMPKIKNR